MTKKIFILTIFLMGLFSHSSIGQSSAQATMRVSVEVVSGSSVEVEQPGFVKFQEGEKSNLGILTMKGLSSGNILVSNTSKLRLYNPDNGEEVTMDIESQKEKNNDSGSIRYEGVSKNKMTSVYSGQLITTIEYL